MDILVQIRVVMMILNCVRQDDWGSGHRRRLMGLRIKLRIGSMGDISMKGDRSTFSSNWNLEGWAMVDMDSYNDNGPDEEE